MESIKLPFKTNTVVLALGAESAGVFAVYQNGNIFVSENFGDLLDENNFLKYKKTALDYLRKEKIKPDVILADLHPLYKTTILGEELAKKYKVPRITVQHHIAHIFSAVGDRIINAKHQAINDKRWNFNFNNLAFRIQNLEFLGIAMDGTGYGLDGNIWGGEVLGIQFPISNFQFPTKSQIQNFKCQSASTVNLPKKQEFKIKRLGSLEEQIMIGGDLAVREPARMIVAIMAKLKTENEKLKTKDKNAKTIKTKEDIYKYVKNFYTRNEFELLYNQMERGFNCQKTTSAGRILDAVSVLLGFAGNERKFKHEAVKKLEENSSMPYDNLDLRFMIYDLRMVLDTTHLFEYLIKNIYKDKKRLAAAAQQYIASGLYEIIKKNHKSKIINHKSRIFAAGGLSNNKIISSYLEKQGVYLSKKIPRGDEGISFGQIIYYLTYSRH